MSRFVRHKKKDRNHREIVDHLRGAGAVVDDVSDLAGLGYDIVVHYENVVVLVEIKDGELPPSARKLTESEEEAKKRHGQKFAVLMNTTEADGLLAAMRWEG